MWLIRGLISFAAHQSQQRQQALENVDQIHVNRQRGSDVVGFTAIDDLFDVIQHVRAENGNCHHGQHHHADRRADKDVDDATHHQHDGADGRDLFKGDVWLLHDRAEGAVVIDTTMLSGEAVEELRRSEVIEEEVPSLFEEVVVVPTLLNMMDSLNCLL